MEPNRYKISIPIVISMCCALIGTLISAIVICAWHLKIDAFIQWIPNSPPMYYNVALGFLVASLGLSVSFFSDENKLFRLLLALSGIFLVLLGALSLFETTYNCDFNIDQLFIKVHEPFASTVFPGRPSVPTAVLFILIGITLFLTSLNAKNKFNFGLAVCFSSLIFTASTCAFLGYLVDINIAYSWGNLTYMAINTTFCFMLMGIGLGGKVFHISHKNEIQNEKWVPLVSFLVSFSIIFMIWISLLIQNKINVKALLEDKVTAVKQALGMSLSDHVFYMGSLADQWNREESSSSKDWDELGNEYLTQHRNNQTIVWLDESFTVKEFSPEHAINLVKSVNIKDLKKKLLKKKNGKYGTFLSIPEEFKNKKISIWEPIYWKGKFVGSVLSILDIENFIDPIVTKQYFPLESALDIFVNGISVYNLVPKHLEQEVYFITSKENLYGTNWEIRLSYPISIFSNTDKLNLHNVILACGFLFAFLFSLVVSFSYSSRRKNIVLEETKSSLLKAQKIAKMGSWVWDLQDQHITCSSEMLTILGFNLNSNYLTADEYFKLINAEDAEQLKMLVGKLSLGNSSFSVIQRLINREGKELIVRLEASVSKYLGNSPIEITGIFQDITEQKKLEMELQQAQKMEIIGQLTGGLAHDFNNLLMVVRGNLELMNEELSGNSKQARRIGLALQAIARGSDLIKRLLSFSRRQTLHAQRIKFQEIIPDFINLLKPTLGESISISISLPEELWPVLIDISQFETALLNLAVNARDAMNGSGKLSVEFENVEIKTPLSIGKETVKPGEYVNVLVKDTGQGMSNEVLEKVFEPFFTTKEVGKGTGLGLSMVYGFIKQSQGYIFIESKVKQGTTVSLYLPKVSLEQKENSQKVIKTSNVAGKETILLVEDEEALLEMTREYLESLGYNIIVAKSGTEALGILENPKGIHLLLTDVIMPGGLTGPKLAVQAMEREPRLKVLFVTGYPRSALSEQQIQTGSFEILTKPYSMQDLANTIRKILNT